jgi:hypothetical protein
MIRISTLVHSPGFLRTSHHRTPRKPSQKRLCTFLSHCLPCLLHNSQIEPRTIQHLAELTLAVLADVDRCILGRRAYTCVTKDKLLLTHLFPLGRFRNCCHAWTTLRSRAVGYGRAGTSLYSVFEGIRL